MRMPPWVDPAVALVLVAAATTEAVVVAAGDPVSLALRLLGAGSLALLAARRRRPLLVLVAVAVATWAAGTLPTLLRADAEVGAGVPLLGLLLAAYSLGAHARLRVAACGATIPLAFALAVDLPVLRGWPLVSGVAFLALVPGLLPLGAGVLVRVRRARLRLLREQEARIEAQRREEHESVVIGERLRLTERLRASVLAGLESLAEEARGRADPAAIEAQARELLTRTRAEVVAFNAPIEPLPSARHEPDDVVRGRRAAAQPWIVIGAGVIAAGVALESAEFLAPSAPVWLAVLAGLAVGGPLAFAGRSPLVAIVVSWAAAASCSRLVVPLDHSLSGTALAVTTPFVVAALSRRRTALLGLFVCGLGQLVGVGTDDPLGEAEVMLASWLGGLAVGEASRLVERTRANNAVLAAEAVVEREHAVVAERLRIAQDLHDAVGHALAVVALQAGVARRLAAVDPPRVAAVLDTIADAALAGIETMTAPDGPGDDLVAVIERTRAAGLDVTWDLTAVSALDAEQLSAVTWVVREALANALRHATGSRVSVSCRRERDEVLVVIADSGAADSGAAASPETAGSGHGLAGIARRAVAVDGEARWGRRADGGFEVRVALPLRAGAGAIG